VQYEPEEVWTDTVDERAGLAVAVRAAARGSEGVRFESRVATTDTLSSVLQCGATVVHYSGYCPSSAGIPTEATAVRWPVQIPSMSLEQHRLPQVVVVSSSREWELRALGRQFVEAGVRHVVVVSADRGLKFILAFSESFYGRLLAGESVKRAFDGARARAQQDDERYEGWGEGGEGTWRDVWDNAFLFPQRGVNHEVSYCGQLERDRDAGQASFEDNTKVVNWCRPSSAFFSSQAFVGRQLELHAAFDCLVRRAGYRYRYVAVTGDGGVGKRAFAHRVAVYASERAAFDMVVCVPFDDIGSFLSERERGTGTGVGTGVSIDAGVDVDVSVLLEYVFWVMRKNRFDPSDIDLTRSERHADEAALLRGLLRGELPGQESLRDRQWHVLFVLDKCDCVVDRGAAAASAFAELLQLLLRGHGSNLTGSTSVITTARTGVTNIADDRSATVDAKEIHLQGLSPADSCALLKKVLPCGFAAGDASATCVSYDQAGWRFMEPLRGNPRAIISFAESLREGPGARPLFEVSQRADDGARRQAAEDGHRRAVESPTLTIVEAPVSPAQGRQRSAAAAAAGAPAQKLHWVFGYGSLIKNAFRRKTLYGETGMLDPSNVDR
jgi:hypothetical protein